MTQIVMPGHTNGAAGAMFGGIMMQWIDVCAGVAAMRHAGGAVVTASIDRLDFHSAVRVGEVVVLEAWVNFVARSSMEIECHVATEDMVHRKRRHTTTAFLTFVAVDESGKPRAVPPLVAETPDDVERAHQASERRAARLRAAGRK